MNFWIDWKPLSQKEIYKAKIEGKLRMSKNNHQEEVSSEYIKAGLEERKPGNELFYGSR